MVSAPAKAAARWRLGLAFAVSLPLPVDAEAGKIAVCTGFCPCAPAGTAAFRGRCFSGFDAVLTPGPGTGHRVQEWPVPAGCMGQDRGDPVPVGIGQGRLCEGVQRLGGEEDWAASSCETGTG